MAMVEACDDDPGEPAVLAELADFVAERMAVLQCDRHLLERALDVIESHLACGADDDDTTGVGETDQFGRAGLLRLLLTPTIVGCLVPWLGPRSLAALESLDATRYPW